jgi:hypothetical protein
LGTIKINKNKNVTCRGGNKLINATGSKQITGAYWKTFRKKRASKTVNTQTNEKTHPVRKDVRACHILFTIRRPKCGRHRFMQRWRRKEENGSLDKFTVEVKCFVVDQCCQMAAAKFSIFLPLRGVDFGSVSRFDQNHPCIPTHALPTRQKARTILIRRSGNPDVRRDLREGASFSARPLRMCGARK